MYYDGFNTGSATRTVIVQDTLPPSKVELYLPILGSLWNTGRMGLDWHDATDTWWVSGYVVQVSTGSNFETLLTSGTVSSTWVYIAWILPDDVYYRRVYAIDNIGNTGQRSDTWNFEVDTTTPTAYVEYIPWSGAWWTSGNIQAIVTGFSEPITWLDYTGYLFTWNDTFVFTFTDLAGNTWTATGIVDWIDKDAPSQITLISPLTDIRTNTDTAAFKRSIATDTGTNGTWAGVMWYWYELSGTNSTGIFVTTTWTIVAGLDEWVYERRVYAIDNVGNTGQRSDTWNFEVDTTTPTAYVEYIPWSGAWWTSGNIQAIVTGFSEPITWLDYTGYLFTWNDTFVFTFTDLAGNTWTATGIVDWIDKDAPSQITLNSPMTWTYTNTWTVPFRRTAATDTWTNNSWAGIMWYWYELSGTNSTGIFTTTTWIIVSWLDEWVYSRRVYAIDNVGNTGQRSDTNNFTIIFAPTVSTGYISSGKTGENEWIFYYKWGIDIRANITWRNITSCEYTTGGSRRITNIQTGYCQATWLTYTWNIAVQFRATNAGGMTTWGIENYIYDDIAPSKVILSSPTNWITGNETNTMLIREESIETWVGIEHYRMNIYSDSWLTNLVATRIGNNTGMYISGLSYTTSYYRNVYAVDYLTNTGETSETFSFITQEKPTTQGGGWWKIITQDICAPTDCSPSYYDGKCGYCPSHGAAASCNTYTDELNNAFIFAFGYGITTISDCGRANLDWVLLRSQMAKMVTNFAIKILKDVPNTGKVCNFIDMKTQTKEMQLYAKIACQLGLMGLESDWVTVKRKFDPRGIVDRAQFGTILSRILRKTKYAGGIPYYIKHLQALKQEGIMTKIENPFKPELRWRVMLMMERVFEKKTE